MNHILAPRYLDGKMVPVFLGIGGTYLSEVCLSAPFSVLPLSSWRKFRAGEKNAEPDPVVSL